MKTNTAIMSC